MSLSKQISLPVLYFLILFFLSFSISHSKLLFLFEHCRHGARSMSHLDKNDKDFIGELWNGKAELSYVGMRQHYLLGVNNKYKYSELLNFSEYNPNDIIVYATNSNRTIMSAQSQLIGMYGSNSSMEKLDDKQKEMATLPFKITDDNILNKIKELNDNVLPYNFVLSHPIHLVDTRDKLFQFEKNGGCPRIKNQRDKNQEKKEIVKTFANEFNKTFGKQLLDYYNGTINNSDFFSDFDNIGDVTGGIIINTVDGRDLSRFSNYNIDLDLLLKKAYEYAAIAATEINSNDSENEIALASSSVLMRKILNEMNNIVENDKKNIIESTNPKFFFLSAHDGTVVTHEDLLRVLFNITIESPVFASNLFFELHKENDNYRVDILFNDKLQATMNYTYFKEKIEKETWTYEQTGIYCGFIEKKSNWLLYTILFVVGIVLLLVVVLVIIMIKKKRNKNAIDIKNAPLVPEK